jgi:peptidoglycan/LPS O-acetylase OafA/YrhL
MNYQTMSKQRKFVLISAAVGFISMFLPWFSIPIFGFNQSVNGMHDKGILVFVCFVVCGVIAYLGDQTKKLEKNMWAITLAAGAFALLIITWFYFQATSSFMGTSIVGLGVYLAAIAAIGIIASAWLFKSPAHNIKDSFNGIRKDIGNRMSTTGNATSPPPDAADTGSANTSVNNDYQNPENINPPL